MPHPSTENSLLIFWILSAIMGSMPEPPANANYFLLWLHNAAQWISANPYKTVKPGNPRQPVGPAKG